MLVAKPLQRLLAAAMLIFHASAAKADTTSDCESHAVAYSRKHGGDIRKVEIKREEFPVTNQYADKVGSQPVSIEMMGVVKITTSSGVRQSRYICLHDGKKAVYFGWVD